MYWKLTGLVTEMDKIGNIGEIKTGAFYTRDDWERVINQTYGIMVRSVRYPIQLILCLQVKIVFGVVMMIQILNIFISIFCMKKEECS